MRLTWLGHTSIRIDSGHTRIYIDPYAGDDAWYEPANVILVSRFDYDHCSLEKIRKMMLDTTKVIGTREVAAEVFPCDILKVGETRKVGDVEIVGMPVLNPRTGQRENAIGFLILVEDKRIYYMADSAYEKEMDKAKPDVLLISVGGTVTHGEREAAQMTDYLAPKLAIPIHWGGPEGSHDDALLFEELTKTPVQVLKPGGSIEV